MRFLLEEPVADFKPTRRLGTAVVRSSPTDQASIPMQR